MFSREKSVFIFYFSFDEHIQYVIYKLDMFISLLSFSVYGLAFLNWLETDLDLGGSSNCLQICVDFPQKVVE